jgi:hypothetical protein
MTTSRQIEANRRNAQLSTGPTTVVGKRKSRRNATRHGLTAETVIDALEDADDYAAFELAVTSDYDARTSVERELVLRLASLLWQLRRATAIESGLFKIQAKHLLQFRRQRQAENHRKPIDNIYRFTVLRENGEQQNDDSLTGHETLASVHGDSVTKPDDLTQSFIRLSNLSACPLDRLSRYEATLWRQACQILWTLRGVDQRKF